MRLDLAKWAATLTGLMATTTAVLVLAGLPGNGHPSEGSDQIEPTEAILLPSPTITGMADPPTAPTSIAGIDPMVTDALMASGHTGFMSTTELEAQLPPSVVDALEEAGAVLVIQDNEDGGAR